MIESSSSHADIKKPVQKRLSWQRILVRGGILVLLGFLLVEWPMREGLSAEPHQADSSPAEPPKPEPRKHTSYTSPDVTFQGRLPDGYERVVAIKVERKTNDIGSNWLSREIIRQGVIIAAEEQLGLTTLDSSIGETIPEGEGSTSPVFIEVSTLTYHQPGDPIHQHRHVIGVTLHHQTAKGYHRWRSTEVEYLGDDWLEPFVKLIEASSRESYVEALTTLGFEKVARTKGAVASVALPEDHLDFTSQYALIRQLHLQQQQQGETPESLGRLVCAYANLGNLIDYHWSAAYKAYEARSLIYAQRLVSKYGATPFSLAHQAYAQALAGRHAAAIQTGKEARAATGTEAPEWLGLIEAYSNYEPEKLEAVQGASAELADYLRMRMVDLKDDPDGSLLAIKRLLERNPACSRALESLSDIKELNVRRMAVEYSPFPQWAEILSRLARVPELPAPVQATLNAAGKSRRVVPQNEITLRVAVASQLQEATKIKDHAGPSWAALADLMRETSYVQAWRLLDVLANALGVSCDESLEQLRPLVAGHRHEKWLDCFVSDRAKAAETYAAYYNGLWLEIVNVNMLPVDAKYAAMSAANPGTKIRRRQSWSCDPTFEDAFRNLNRGLNLNTPLSAISPKWPMAIAEEIAAEPLANLRKWEDSHGESPAVLLALYVRYYQHGAKEDSLRCLEKLITLQPTSKNYTKLAWFYKLDGQRDKRRAALKRAGELPSRGLESAHANYELAEEYCDEGNWEAAKPHALLAAESYAGWGLLSAARVLEGLEEWDEAEAYIRANAERYEASSAHWYLWCIRTGHGDMDQALTLAENYWNSPSFSGNLISKTWYIAISKIIEGDSAGARQVLAGLFQVDTKSSAMAAVLADADGEAELRDKIFHDLEPKGHHERGFVQLTNLFRGVLSGKEECRWNKNAFEEVLINTTETKVISYLYLTAGLFLGNHGEPELAVEYMKCAATDPPNTDIACYVAMDLLRKRQIAIDPARKTRFPEPIAEMGDLLLQFRKAYDLRKFDDAESALTKAFELRSDYVPALVMRGSLRLAKEQYAEARADFEEALRLDPNYASAYLNLSWLLSTCPNDEIRDGKRALELAEQALIYRQFELSINAATIAAAYAEGGDLEKASESETRAQKLPGYDPKDADRLAAYKAGKPFRQQHSTAPAQKALKK